MALSDNFASTGGRSISNYALYALYFFILSTGGSI